MLSNVKRLRRELGISQQKLADAIMVSQQSINKYENHDVEPDIQTLTRLADFFDTSIDYVVGRTDIRRKIEITETFHLNAQEAEILESFRTLDIVGRDCIHVVAKALLARGPK